MPSLQVPERDELALATRPLVRANAGGDAEAATVEQITPELYRELGLDDAAWVRIGQLLGRQPNMLELGLFSVMWSEHCSYCSSKPLLRGFPTTGDHVLQGPGENAGIIDIGDGLAVSFKIESHNHPTAIEPYQGAATGVGGIIRDVFTMGARPIALLNSLRFGPIDGGADDARNRHLFSGAVAGIAGYGNCVGIPTVGGEVVFDESYRHNPLVNAMCVGLLRHDEIATGAASGVGNPVLAVGARTGRDGIHGATFASVEDPLGRERSAVQVGDPFLEKLLLEACLELIATGDVVGIQDMGAAGLTSSSAEMASRSGSGIDLDLLEVPRRESGMTPYELMLSESQERMLVVMQQGREHVATEILERWGLEAAVIGRVTDDGMLRLREGELVVAEVPVTALVDEAPEYHRSAQRPAYLAQTGAFDVAGVPQLADAGTALHELLASPTIASKEWVHRQYDSMVRTATVVRPGSDAAVVAVRGTDKALAISTDGNGRYAYLDPRAGGQHAVAEAARNVVCSGGRPMAVTDCLNFSTPEDPEIFWQLREACAGLAEACEVLGTPVISGNVSLYNQSGGLDIHPTPIVGMVGLVEHPDHVTTQAWRGAGNSLLLVGATDGARLDGSEYLARLHGMVAGGAPPIDLQLERAVQQTVLGAIRAGLVQSAHDASDGGLAVALAESAIDGHVGARVALAAGNGRIDELLFGEAASRIVLEVAPADVALVQALCNAAQVELLEIGTVGGDTLRIDVDDAPLVDEPVAGLERSWKEAIPCLMQ